MTHILQRLQLTLLQQAKARPTGLVPLHSKRFDILINLFQDFEVKQRLEPNVGRVLKDKMQKVIIKDVPGEIRQGPEILRLGLEFVSS